MSALPIKGTSCDAVIAVNVLNHGLLDKIDQAVLELKRVLKPQGRLFLTLLSTKDFRFGRGDQIDEYTYKLRDDPEEGIVHSFFSRSMVEKLLRGMELTGLFEERNTIRDEKVSYRWIIETQLKV